ncbi:MAG: hypothetical protein RBT37_02650 [Dissulfurispiraceae bacterium]|jgi:hypothetical protein|nr:hypothetical protein [Dissulfurispiraceae bacterium]
MIGKSLTSASIYVNHDTIAEKSSIKTVEIKTIPADSQNNSIDEKPAYRILREIQEKEFGSYACTTALWQVRCIDMTYRIVRFTIHYKDNQQPSTDESPDAEWQKALHGSSAEMVIEYLCR